MKFSRLSEQHSQPKNCAATLLIRRVTCSWRWSKCIQRFYKEFYQQSSISWCSKIVKISGRYHGRCLVSFYCTRITLGMPAIFIRIRHSLCTAQCSTNPFDCLLCRSMKESIIRSQPLDKQQTIAHWFDNLMENVERNLSMKNRDKYVLISFPISVVIVCLLVWYQNKIYCLCVFRFSQNLSLFRRDVNETLKQANLNASNSTPGSGGSSINDMIVS